MNKDLAGVSAIWRALFGCGVAAFGALFVYLSSYCQRAAGDVLRRILGPSLETGAVFDAVLSVNYCAIAICASVMAVQEKCDEKRQIVRLGKSHARDGGGIPPFSQSARKRWGTPAAYRLPLWLRRGQGVSEEFQAVGEREHTTP